MARRLRRVVKHKYTPAVMAVPAKPATSKRPATPAQPAVPGSSITTTQQTYGGSLNTGISGDPQVIMVMLIALLVVVSWNDLSSSIASIIWNPSSNKDIKTLNWGKYLGMMVFISMAVILSLTGEEMSGIILMITIGVWAVYLIESNGGNFTSLFSWLTKISGSSQSQSK